MIHSFASHVRSRKLALTGGGLLLVALFLLGLGLNQRYLRTSVFDSQPDETPPTAPSPAQTTSVHTADGFTLTHPSNWQPTKETTANATTTTVGPVTITQYKNTLQIPENIIANQLGIGVTDLYSWQGDLGQTSGLYWSRRSLVAGTAAPEGPRLYVTENDQGTVTVALPGPPYETGVNQIIQSFQTP